MQAIDLSIRGQKKAPDRARLAVVRGNLILRGTTLAHWSRARGEDPASVYNAIAGLRNGPKARRILAEILGELGLEQ